MHLVIMTTKQAYLDTRIYASKSFIRENLQCWSYTTSRTVVCFICCCCVGWLGLVFTKVNKSPRATFEAYPKRWQYFLSKIVARKIL